MLSWPPAPFRCSDHGPPRAGRARFSAAGRLARPVKRRGDSRGSGAWQYADAAPRCGAPERRRGQRVAARRGAAPAASGDRLGLAGPASPSSTSSGPRHRAPSRRCDGPGVDLLRRLDQQRAGDEPRVEAPADPLPELGGLQPEPAVRRRRVERAGVALGLEAVLAQPAPRAGRGCRAGRSRTASTSRRAQRPGAVRDDEDHAAARRQHPPDLGQQRVRAARRSRGRARRSAGRREPAAIGQRVSSTSAQTFGAAGRPGHHPLLARHQRQHPARRRRGTAAASARRSRSRPRRMPRVSGQSARSASCSARWAERPSRVR